MIVETDQDETNGSEPSLARLTRKTLTTGLGALENRAELFVVEVQEEKDRVLKLVWAAIGTAFLAMMTALLLTGTVIFTVSPEYRSWVALGFSALYLAGTIAAVFGLKSLLKRAAFTETLRQI